MDSLYSKHQTNVTSCNNLCRLIADPVPIQYMNKVICNKLQHNCISTQPACHFKLFKQKFENLI